MADCMFRTAGCLAQTGKRKKAVELYREFLSLGDLGDTEHLLTRRCPGAPEKVGAEQEGGTRGDGEDGEDGVEPRLKEAVPITLVAGQEPDPGASAILTTPPLTPAGFFVSALVARLPMWSLIHVPTAGVSFATP